MNDHRSSDNKHVMREFNFKETKNLFFNFKF